MIKADQEKGEKSEGIRGEPCRDGPIASAPANLERGLFTTAYQSAKGLESLFSHENRHVPTNTFEGFQYDGNR